MRCRFELLQLRRSSGSLAGTWQPVMGHALADETSPQTALRELAEETSYRHDRGLLRLWQLESVNTYFLASHEAIVKSPGFAALVSPSFDPILNDEHDAFRWVPRDHADLHFLWPGHRQAVREITRDIFPVLCGGVSLTAPLLELSIPSINRHNAT